MRPTFIKIVGIVIIFLGILAIIYATIAGIWGFAPNENFNIKMIGTSGMICTLGIIIIWIWGEDGN